VSFSLQNMENSCPAGGRCLDKGLLLLCVASGEAAAASGWPGSRAQNSDLPCTAVEVRQFGAVFFIHIYIFEG